MPQSWSGIDRGREAPSRHLSSPFTMLLHAFRAQFEFGMRKASSGWLRSDRAYMESDSHAAHQPKPVTHRLANDAWWCVSRRARGCVLLRGHALRAAALPARFERGRCGCVARRAALLMSDAWRV